MKNQQDVEAAKAEIKKSIRMALGRERLNRYFKRRNLKLTQSVQDFADAVFDNAVEKARHKFLMKFDDAVDDWTITTEDDRRKITKEPVMTEGYFTEDIYTQVARSMQITRERVKGLLLEESQNFYQDHRGRFYPKTKTLVLRCTEPEYCNDLTVYTEQILGHTPSSNVTVSDQMGIPKEWKTYASFHYAWTEKQAIASIQAEVGYEVEVVVENNEREVKYIVWIG